MNKAISYRDVKVYYKIEGKGPVIMLLHGFIEEGSMWDEAVKHLAKKYKVIVPDLPGFGQSPMFGSTTTLTMEVYAELVEAITVQERLKRFVLLGHSMGGYVTLSYAGKYESKLLGFGLINSHCFADSPEKKENRKKGIEFIKRHGTKVFVTELYNNIFHPSFKKTNKGLIDRLILKAEKYAPEAVMRANAAMMNREDKSEILKAAKVPVLFINGKQDESAPFTSTLKQASYPKVADIHFFDNCKHMCIFERKTETLAIIDSFCSMALS